MIATETDPNVKVPNAILRAAARADEIHKQAYQPGHRAAHLEQKIAAERMGELKQSGAKKIIDMVLAFLFGVLALGAVSWFKNQK